MDFTYLIELAKANEEKSKTDNSFKFSTKVSTAKKVNKSGPKADAVNKVLSKIEQEKQKKDEEFAKKRDELLALRAKDKHSTKRVHTLINRTKGASKAVLDDAKDIGTAKCEEQCDEDDYGYESTISQQIFSKLQNKYCAMPEDERLKFNKTPKANMEDIKKRVMSSLKQEQEESLGIRKRKRKRKTAQEDDGFINDGDEYNKFGNESEETKREDKEKSDTSKSKSSSKKVPVNVNVTNYKSDKYSNFKYSKDKSSKDPPTKPEKERSDSTSSSSSSSEKKKKPSAKAPPPLSFGELMKVAQKKQTEPIPIIDPLRELEEKRRELAKDVERPLTAKEKKEQEEEKLRKLKKMWKLPSATEKENEKSTKDSKTSVTSKEEKSQENTVKTTDKSKYFAVPPSLPKPTNKSALKPSKSSGSNSNNSIPNKSNTSDKNFNKSTAYRENTSNKTTSREDLSKENTKRPTMPKDKSTEPSRKYIPQKLPSSKDSRPEKAPPRKFPPPYIPRKVPMAPPSKRRIDSDESEYDSEMDDFIDDGEDEMDYSSEIAKMFKYDKSKFKDVDDDVDDMEASYSQLEKEEIRSAKIGLMEDLQDMKMEEEERKRKKMRMKKK